MLSYKTIIAVQLLKVILETGEKGLTVTDMINLTGLQNIAVSRTAFMLRKSGWVRLKNRNRHVVKIKLDEKSLYDLVVLTDGQIQLSTKVILKHWGYGSLETMQKPMKINQCLHDTVKKWLQKIKISDLLQETGGKNKMAMIQEK